ncbi:MAG: hypothetical protein HS101_20050 [Planctomycetia bacterium]|nr:hypothetical protein [Planctomycetia bacterium]
MPLDQTVARPLRQHTAIVCRDDELHAASQRVRAFSHAYDFDAVLFEVFDQNVRFGGAAEAIKFVDVEPFDAAGFRFRNQLQQFGPSACRAACLRFVDEVLERLARRLLARIDLNGDACAVILRVA